MPTYIQLLYNIVNSKNALCLQYDSPDTDTTNLRNAKRENANG